MGGVFSLSTTTLGFLGVVEVRARVVFGAAFLAVAPLLVTRPVVAILPGNSSFLTGGPEVAAVETAADAGLFRKERVETELAGGPEVPLVETAADAGLFR